MSLISSFEIIKVAVPEPYIFFGLLHQQLLLAAVIPNGAKIFFAIGTAFINVPAILLFYLLLQCTSRLNYIKYLSFRQRYIN